MQWFPDLANAAFCETIELRRKILELQQTWKCSVYQGLEPSNAEYIAALAAGNNSINIVQIGGGISTIALAVAVKATGGLFTSIHTDVLKQDIIRYHMDYLGLTEYVQLLISNEPSNVLISKANVDFAHFTGNPKDYIQYFDCLSLNNKAIIAADNAFTEASIKYVQHVRQQPGVTSSTLPFARGIEITRLASWEKFNAGRMLHSDAHKATVKAGGSEIHSGSSVQGENTTITFLLANGQRSIIEKHMLSSTEDLDSMTSFERTSLTETDFEDPDDRDRSFLSCTNISSIDSLSCSEMTIITATDGGSDHSPSSRTIHSESIESTKTEYSSKSHGNSKPASEIVLESDSIFEIHFQNYSMDTEVTITGLNREMLLSDITTAFSEMGISIKTANIETRDDFIEDVFYITDAKSGAPLHPSEWDSVRERLLYRIVRPVK
ncbi:hypothetical protein KP509_04G046200 [Ceratopteris richardii]|uniref:ACT domain-containing protein n=1 Tax=Ceratopteris richardii TaxID=49495 RepID=A0A8T2V012_CERRI|nr:hypothetical protein KP509_04G046200 [Ceratopteris richardii]